MYQLLRIILFSSITFACYADNPVIASSVFISPVVAPVIVAPGTILNRLPSLLLVLNAADNINSNRNNQIISNSVLLSSEMLNKTKIIAIVIEEDVINYPILTR